MRISDWSSDVCSSDLNLAAETFHLEIGRAQQVFRAADLQRRGGSVERSTFLAGNHAQRRPLQRIDVDFQQCMRAPVLCLRERCHTACRRRFDPFCDAQKMTLEHRSEEHKSELQSLMRI